MSKFTAALKKVGILQEENSLPEDQLKGIRLHAQQMLDREDTPEDLAIDPSTGTPEVCEPVNPPAEGLLPVKEVYKEFGMASLDCSIFKVGDFLEALPDQLPAEVKKQSVLGILKATNLDAANLLEDGRQRIDALDKALASFTAETENVLTQSTVEIENLQTKIDEQKQIIQERKKLQEDQETLIHDEITRINGILNFLG